MQASCRPGAGRDRSRVGVRAGDRVGGDDVSESRGREDRCADYAAFTKGE